MGKRGRFVRLVCPGKLSVSEEQVVGEVWRSGKHLFLPGYHAERKVTISDTDDCTVGLRIFMGDNGQPVYSCTCVCKDGDHGGTYGHAARPVIENFLGFCGACGSASGSGRRWSGPSFFGFDRPDVRVAVEEALLLPPVPVSDLRKEYATLCVAQEKYVETFAVPGTGRTGTIVQWAGVMHHGEPVESPHWLLAVGNDHVVYLRDGYQSCRQLTLADEAVADVVCSVVKDAGHDEKPLFKCTWSSGEVSGACINNVVQEVFTALQCSKRRRWESYGLQFFGLHLMKVPFSEGSKEADKENNANSSTADLSPLTRKIRSIQRRSAGPSSHLAKQHRAKRMELCEEAVDLITFGDLVDFVKHVMETNPGVVDAAIDSSPLSQAHLYKKLVRQPQPVIFSPAQSGELLAGAHSLSERAYKNTRKILMNKNVHLATYDAAAKHLRSLDVGQATSTDCPEECEQCFTYNLIDTLKRIVSEPELYQKFHFPSPGQQHNLFRQLQERRPDVYSALRPADRTLFLRQTGDNYRAALKRQPTQQMSVSVLNLRDLIYSPLGQFVISSWRGGETRKSLRAHMTATFQELDTLAREGLTLTVAGQDEPEHFNIVVLYVADYSHLKEVLGRVQVNAEQGCPLCDRPASTWHKPQAAKGEKRNYRVMEVVGKKADVALGLDPNKTSSEYKAWYQAHGGQTGSPLLKCLCPDTVPPCALHLQLSLHRSLWKKISVVVKSHDQEDNLPLALRSIGCTYLAYQVEQYFKNKKKAMMAVTPCK